MRLPTADPKDVGLDPDRLAAVEASLADGLEAGEYTAAVYLIARHGKVAFSGAMGRLGKEEGDPEADINTIFDMASVTKPVSTAASLMVMVERGLLHLNQPVTAFFPDRSLPHLSNVTLRQLVTHTSGLPSWKPLFSGSKSREDSIESLFQTALENQPGTKHVYSCLGYIMLGLAMEQASGMSLADFAAESIFRPLEMDDSGFNPPKEKLKRVAKTAHSQEREDILTGEVHDENAHSLGGVSGNAGLFSTGPDIAVFAQMMLNGGEFEPQRHGGHGEGESTVRILSPLSVAKMMSNRINPTIGGQSYGLFTRPNEMTPCGDLFSDRCAGHTGFTGTSLLMDPQYDMFAILLTNRVYCHRESPMFLKRRRLFHNIAASAIR